MPNYVRACMSVLTGVLRRYQYRPYLEDFQVKATHRDLCAVCIAGLVVSTWRGEGCRVVNEGLRQQFGRVADHSLSTTIDNATVKALMRVR